MRCALAVVTVWCLTALATGCGSKHAESSPSTPRQHVIVLHRGEEKDLVRASPPATLIRCISHGVAISAEPASGEPNATNGRDLWKRGKNGTASLSISTAADGHVHAACS